MQAHVRWCVTVAWLSLCPAASLEQVAGPRSSRPWEMFPLLRPPSRLDSWLAFQSPLLLPSRVLTADTLLLNDCPVILESLFEGRQYGTEQKEMGQSAFKFWLYCL